MSRALILAGAVLLSGPAVSQDARAWAAGNLGAPDAVVRDAARRILAGSGARAELLEAIGSSCWRTREGALAALAWSAEPPPAADLRALASDPDWPVRRALALLWGWHRLGRDVPQRLLEDPFHDVRVAAVLALAAQPGPPAPELARALLDRAAPVRQAACHALICAPRQLRLEALPEEAGGLARRRTLRALATRPTPAQAGVLRAFLDQDGAGLGERLIALEALLSLGIQPEAAGELVLAGLMDPAPAVRSTAVATGLLLQADVVSRLAAQGYLLPDQEHWESFLKIAARHGRALAPGLPAALARLAAWRAAERELLSTCVSMAGIGARLAAPFLEEFDAATGERLARLAGLVAPEAAPGVGDWLLAALGGAPAAKTAEALFPALLRHSGRPDVRAFLLERMPGLPPWRQRDLARELLRRCRDEPAGELLRPLEQSGLIEEARARADYLAALEGFPARPRFLELLRRLFGEDPEAAVRITALRIWMNSSGEPQRPEPALLLRVAAWPGASEALQRACLEAAAWGGAWEALAGFLSGLGEPGRAGRLRRQMTTFIRDKGLRGGIPLLEQWAGEGGGLGRDALQALAWFGVEGAAERLAEAAGQLGEAELGRVVRALKGAPGDVARRAIEAWTAADRPDYYLEAACRLAEGRAELPLRPLLESLARQRGARVQAAALAALVRRGERELPAALFPELLQAPPGSEEEGILAEVLDAIGQGSAPWAVPILWRAVLEKHLRHPLQEVARTLDPSNYASRSVVGRARILSGHLYAQEDEAVAAGLEELLEAWAGTPGLALLGGDVLHCLLDETREQGGRGARPKTAHRLLGLGRWRAPRGQPLRLACCLALGEEAEAQGRWAEGAALYEEALLILLLGGIDGRTQEHLMGPTEPAAGRFPISRLAALPHLLRARALREAGQADAAANALGEALEQGGVDALLRRQAGPAGG